MVPTDSGFLGSAFDYDRPIITLSKRVERQPDKWQYNSTDNTPRGHVPEYAFNVWMDATFAYTIGADVSDGQRDTEYSKTSTSFGPAWDTEFDQSGDVKGTKINIGSYQSSPSDDNPAQSVIRNELDLLSGEFSNALLYGVYTHDTCDKSYTGENWEPCGRYVINTKNLLLQWNGENSTPSVSFWSNGGLGTTSIDTTVTYNNSGASIEVVNSGAGTGSAYQDVLTATNDYNITGYAYRYSGGSVPKVSSNGAVLWTYSGTGPGWQFFDIDLTAAATDISFECVSGGAAQPVFFDNLRVTNANDTTGWAPFAANRSCSAFLMSRILSHNSNRASRRTLNAWSIPV
jgi:hypothetical protein